MPCKPQGGDDRAKHSFGVRAGLLLGALPSPEHENDPNKRNGVEQNRRRWSGRTDDQSAQDRADRARDVHPDTAERERGGRSFFSTTSTRIACQVGMMNATPSPSRNVAMRSTGGLSAPLHADN